MIDFFVFIRSSEKHQTTHNQFVKQKYLHMAFRLAYRKSNIQMKMKNVKWKQRKEPPSFPTWLKSYHLLLAAVVVMLIFGALMKYLSR